MLSLLQQNYCHIDYFCNKELTKPDWKNTLSLHTGEDVSRQEVGKECRKYRSVQQMKDNALINF